MQPPEDRPPYEYPWAEFDEQMNHFLTVASPNLEEVRSYFRSQYRTEAEARWKQARFQAARSFLDVHHGRFEEFYVRGAPQGEPTGGMLGDEVLVALWRFYAAAPDRWTTKHPPLETILRLAREERDHRKS